MRKFVLSLLVVISVGIGCTEAQMQQITSTFSTSQYNAQTRSVQQTTSLSNTQATTVEGDTPLILASRQGDLKTVQALLASGADVNATNSQGTTALMAASEAGYADIIKALGTNKQLDLEATDRNFDTALMLAVRKQQEPAVKALLDLGANVNFMKAGMSVLIAASYQGNAEIVRDLLDAGANADWVDENNESALDVAVNTNKPAVAAVLREYQNKKM